MWREKVLDIKFIWGAAYEGNFEIESRKGDLLYEFQAETRLTVYRRLGMAKPGRLGPAQNDKLMENFIELTLFCIITLMKAHRISCPEYIEDLDKCDKM